MTASRPSRREPRARGLERRSRARRARGSRGCAAPGTRGSPDACARSREGATRSMRPASSSVRVNGRCWRSATMARAMRPAKRSSPYSRKMRTSSLCRCAVHDVGGGHALAPLMRMSSGPSCMKLKPRSARRAAARTRRGRTGCRRARGPARPRRRTPRARRRAREIASRANRRPSVLWLRRWRRGRDRDKAIDRPA